MTPSLLPLRQYQREAIDAVFEAWSDGMRRPAVVLPTGSGKTVIFSHLTTEFAAQNRGLRTVILVHREELADQALAKLKAIAPHLSAGKIKAASDDVWAQVMVCSVQTLSRERRMHALLESQKKYGPVGLVITDECHHGAAPIYGKVYAALDQAQHVGFTATLSRGDGIGLGNVWDDVVYTKSLMSFIGSGYLVQPHGISVPVDSLDLGSVKKSRGDYQVGELEDALQDAGAMAAAAQAYKDHAPDRPGVVFTPTVATAGDVAQELKNRGIVTEVVSGETPREERLRIFRDYREGRVQCLANCMVLCLDTETEILTDRGWTTYSEMTPEHRVANWDQGRVFFKEPYEIVVRDRGEEEDMYVLETDRRSIRVTGRHRMLYRTSRTGPYLKAPVDELAGRTVALPTTGLAEPERIVDLTEDECALIGFWLGDGSLNRPGGGIEYTLSQSTSYPHIIRWVDDLLRRVGIDHRRYDKSHYKTPHIRWSLPRGTGGKSQRRNGVQRFEAYLNKSGSDLLWNLSKSQFDALLTGLWYADGNHGQAENGLPPSFAIYGCAVSLLETIQAVASVRGWTCSLRAHHVPKAGHRQLYRLWFHTRPDHRMGGTDPRYRIQKETSLWRPEKVWCVRTETRNIITRRRGSVTVMGNTEGFDAPWAEVAVIARPTQSQPLYVQMVGRVLRPWPGKTSALVLDIVGATSVNRLKTLVDLEPGLFPEAKPCRECDRVPCVCACTQCGERRTRCACPKQQREIQWNDAATKAGTVDLFAGSESVWLRTQAGGWFIPAGDDLIVLWPEGEEMFSVCLAPKTGAWSKLHESLPMGTAMAWAEAEAEERGGSLGRRSARWRKNKASEKQLDYARRVLKIDVPDGARSGEVGDMISVRVGTSRLDRFLAPRLSA